MGIQDEDGEDGRWRPGAVGVLLVSEDVGWRDRLGAALRAEGYVVFADDRGEAAFARPRLPIDVAVVDMGIEALSPAAVCAELRSRRPIPILAVQAVERETIVLAAYEAGADQFVPLDASEREFVARIRALLRRVPPERREVIDLRLSAARSISLDPRTLEATVAGTRVALSEREFEVLHALLRQPGRVVPRSELVGEVSGRHPERVLDFVIRRLREKLEAVDGVRRIGAMRGVGFRFLFEDFEDELADLASDPTGLAAGERPDGTARSGGLVAPGSPGSPPSHR